MSEFKGTPGPWKATLGGGTWRFMKPTTEIHGPRGEIIAILVGHGADGEHEPESCLIAAAPRMLRALDMAETSLALESKTCAEFPDGDKRCWECLGCMRQATHTELRDAIAAVLGEQS